MYRKAMTAFEIAGQAVKTSNRESESELQRTKDGNAQFSLCCTSTAMPDDDSQDRHPAFCLQLNQEAKNAGSGPDSGLVSGFTRYFSIRETCPAASCQRLLRLISVSVNCTTRSNGLPSAVPFTRVFPRTTATSSP